ncbi:MAG: hypothetical protein JSU87_04915 [Gemmatimonadota bacterium]|nr:MAG: hypothetical protein JSU87_04915 [Gemmatimonadota bacterium]
MTLASAAGLGALIQSGELAPLPASSPIGGPFWSYVVPAALLAVAFVGTLLLYRHFAKSGDGT